MFSLPLLFLIAAPTKPAMRDFIGLNVHTVLFKPILYRPIASLVRDYHGITWDLGNDPSNVATFPMSRNGVNWLTLYGEWIVRGYRIDVTAQFDGLAPEKWNAKNAFAYGESFARYFGPSGEQPMVETVEIGNEPAEFNLTQYRNVFENMAKGIRAGDPKLKIATCAVALGNKDKYAKDVACLSGLESLIDVVNLHIYPFVEEWPTWRRSYPEDPKIDYLKKAEQMIRWRNSHAQGRPLWVTEFGYDASTKPNKTSGDFAKWVGNTDEEQAKYIVRSFLVFSAMDIQRAYLYWFNDNDDPQLHGSSGLTRNYQPKPSFYAVRHLQKSLADFRFEKAVIQNPGAAYLYQYQNVRSPNEFVWVAWSPTGSNRTSDLLVPNPKATLTRAEQMPLTDGPAPTVRPEVLPTQLKIKIGENPVYLWFKR
jgi:hypothetical protein